jgi:hypothetical protein
MSAPSLIVGMGDGFQVEAGRLVILFQQVVKALAQGQSAAMARMRA